MAALTGAFIGRGPLLVACGNRWMQRGHALSAVITDCAEATGWAQQRGLVCMTTSEAKADRLPADLDYLFSIVNHTIIAPEILARARRAAINYHDSLLPDHAGFNATSWAILEGRPQHGITFHLMTERVDQGPVLVQRRFEVHEDDTAFTLAVRCGEACVSGFFDVVTQIESGHLTVLPMAEGGSFHLRSERLGPGVLSFEVPANKLLSQIRALTFGPHDNWMGTPKLRIADDFFAIRQAELDHHAGLGRPGEVLALSSAGLSVATVSGVLRITELTTLTGEPFPLAKLCEGPEPLLGTQLSGLSESVETRAGLLDATVSKQERFWVRRLAQARAPALPDGGEQTANEATARMSRRMPQALADLTVAERRAMFAFSLAAYLLRLGEEEPFDLALYRDIEPPLCGLYATSTPLRIALLRNQTVTDALIGIRAELSAHDERLTYARDIVLRYENLTSAKACTLPIALCFHTALESAQLQAGTRLLLVAAGDGSYGFTWDTTVWSHEQVTRIAERCERLIEAALNQPALPISALPIVTNDERAHLLALSQGPRVDSEQNVCVHTLFERQADQTPEAIALAFGDQTLSYRELDSRANAVAHALIEAGVGASSLVGVSIERSLELVVALLGVLKAGGAYVPLDPVYPLERLEVMLEDSKAQVLLTQGHLRERLPSSQARLLDIATILSSDAMHARARRERPSSAVAGHDLAYVIFTSGSTGRPKGVMVQHDNVANFFAGMDRALGPSENKVWLAVTSVSFDISVLEIFYALCRGFKVVVQEEGDRASLTAQAREGTVSKQPMGFGLFYFAADSSQASRSEPYRLLLEGARFADSHDFTAIWTPERHFHAFGGLYPNPAVTTAALATITTKVALRAGSVVLPLHHPLRVAEDWSVIDNLSGGRVGLSFASGWHVNDFAFAPENYEKRREVMSRSIETVLKLWRGEKVSVKNGAGQDVEVSILPRPVQAQPPLWIASAGSLDTFELAGRMGVNVLTNMLGQDLNDLTIKLAAYRAARRAAGHAGEGIVSLMLHTFVCEDTERARALVKKPFCDYLKSSFDLVKVAPFMFPAFRKPSLAAGQDAALDSASFSDEDLDALLDHAFDRYFDTAGLFGTPERALSIVEQLKQIGVNEVACLIDFGVPVEEVLQSLPQLDRLRRLSNTSAETQLPLARTSRSIGAQIHHHQVSHLQCTPSHARMLLESDEDAHALSKLEKLLLGGEALPRDLLDKLEARVSGEIHNMYGPTETTVWSTTDRVERGARVVSIGKPIANTVTRILDRDLGLLPVGEHGELYIGGAGVVRGYLGRVDLTRERFVSDPYASGERLYRTGDLARFLPDGRLEFLGRLDNQIKINGYRVELGEIEACLGRHRAVRQSVVVAREDAHKAGTLVAYVVPAQPSPGTHHDQLAHWHERWETAYQSKPLDQELGKDARFNTAGWTDSFSGELLADEPMREWLEQTRQRVLAFTPRRVLEIGCGTGMILFGLLPHVEHYTALDVSQAALDAIRAQLSPADLAKVTLVHAPAHQLGELVPRSFDTVIINSVVQYFPDRPYLETVLTSVTELVADSGRVFVGDVRSYPQLALFQTLVAGHQCAPDTPREQLRANISRRIEREPELLLSEAFFAALPAQIPRIAGAEWSLKTSRHWNEMTAFRYDVVLHVGPHVLDASVLPPPHGQLSTFAQCELLLRDRPQVLVLSDLPNLRLARAIRAERALAGPEPLTGADLATLLDREEHSDEGIDPAAFCAYDKSYEVRLTWARSGDPARFDVVLRARDGHSTPLILEPAATEKSNQPCPEGEATLELELRRHLQKSLPEYMIPSSFVTLPALPLTPNGKIDRKALPAPSTIKQPKPTHYEKPGTPLETQIADLWQRLLGIERVGRNQNIFDLGANSLLTVQAGQQLSNLLGKRIPLLSLFRFPTVAALSQHLGNEDKPRTEDATRADAREGRRKEAAERRRRMRVERATSGEE